MQYSSSRLRYVVCAALTASASSAGAVTNTEYISKTDFLAAAGPTVVEDFNAETPRLFSVGSPESFTGFSVSVSALLDSSIGVLTAAEINDPDRLGTIPNVPSTNPTNALGWYGNNTAVGSSQGPTFSLEFTQPTTALGFDYFDSDNTDAFRIRVSNNDQPFNDPPWGPGFVGDAFFGIVSDTPFDRVDISFFPPEGGFLGSFSMDNVYTSVVPVPAAAWLFGSGLLGLIGVARRKKA